ncbi:hypothetical protein [uncultured Metabacillus sp.]|uniref:hypothetical protein n=1 Tax=uncultured Metabacillus sp. TaxID=2860135 RepID=UPI0026166EE8|nr:hypothetical protein [uncultured Metabacillus sp.]
MVKLHIEFEGDYEVRENVYENKIMSMGKMISDLGDSTSYDLILPPNPKVKVSIKDSNGELKREIKIASLIISDNKDKEVLINNIAALLQKSL